MRKLLQNKKFNPYTRKFTRWGAEKSQPFANYPGSSSFRGARQSFYNQARAAAGYRNNFGFMPPMLQYPPALPAPAMPPSYAPLGNNVSVGPQKKMCFKCGEEGHIKAQCPK